MYRAPVPRRKGLNFKQVKQVQKIIQKNQQIKTVRQPILATVDSTGALEEITLVGTGDDFFERLVDKIKVQSIKFPYSIAPNTTSTSLRNMRVMVVRGKYGPLTLTDMPTSVTAQADLDKMQVYHDRVYFLVANQDSINGHAKVPFYKSFKNKKVPHLLVHYDDDVSATAAQSNPLYVFYIADSSTTPPNIIGYVDMKFFDAT